MQGLAYDNYKKDEYVSNLSGNKNGHSIKSDQNSHWVVPTGIEPVSKV
jgi:hypothetical protein